MSSPTSDSLTYPACRGRWFRPCQRRANRPVCSAFERQRGRGPNRGFRSNTWFESSALLMQQTNLISSILETARQRSYSRTNRSMCARSLSGHIPACSCSPCDADCWPFPSDWQGCDHRAPPTFILATIEGRIPRSSVEYHQQARNCQQW
jgi:hypothetical protein